MENGVNIYSEAPTRVSKRTGERLKPKMVTCATLQKRLKEAGLEHLYKRRMPMVDVDVDVDSDVDSDDEVEMGPLPMMGPCGKDQVYLDGSCQDKPMMGPLPMMGPCGKDQVYRGGSCHDKLKVDPACDAEWKKISGGKPWLARQYKGYAVGSAPCSSREMVPVEVVTDNGKVEHVLLEVDPACAADFQAFAEKKPNNRSQAKFLKEYKGYAKGSGPCSSRKLVPTQIHGDEDDVEDYRKTAGFDLFYGRRRPYSAGARPKKSQKHVGEIVVKGRRHLVFKGKEGGLYYMKGKTGTKVYIDKKRLKKH